MQHFYKDDNMNIFRLPVGWQYLTNNVVGGDLDATNFEKYDELMQSCLDLGAKVRDSMIHLWCRHDHMCCRGRGIWTEMISTISRSTG